MEVIERENLISRGRDTGEHIRRRLEREIGELGILGQVRGRGALSCVEFVQDMKTMQSFPAEVRFGKRLEHRMRGAGLLTRCDPNWVAFAPPLIMTLTQADEMLDIFVRCVKEELQSLKNTCMTTTLRRRNPRDMDGITGISRFYGTRRMRQRNCAPTARFPDAGSSD